MDRKNNILMVKSQQGFTMVEALVTVLIFSFILGGIYGILNVGQGIWEVNNTRIQLQQETRKAMEQMISELREAGDSSIVDVDDDSAWHSTITFKVPSTVTGGSLIWDANNIQYVLGGAGNTQLLRTQSGVTKVIGQNFQSIQFRRQASQPDTLEVTMQVRKNSATGRLVTYQTDFSVQLRN